jgi:rubredoxin
MLGPLRISRRIFHGVLVSQSQSSTHSATMTANVNVVQQHFVHLPERAVIICRLCGYVMNPDRGVQRHLTDIHQAIPLGVWKQLVACSKSIWIGSPDEIIAPSRISLPIQGLSLPKGWECDRCGYVSLKEGSMREHCRRKHRWTKAQGLRPMLATTARADNLPEHEQEIFGGHSDCRTARARIKWNNG